MGGAKFSPILFAQNFLDDERPAFFLQSAHRCLFARTGLLHGCTTKQTLYSYILVAPVSNETVSAPGTHFHQILKERKMRRAGFHTPPPYWRTNSPSLYKKIYLFFDLKEILFFCFQSKYKKMFPCSH